MGRRLAAVASVVVAGALVLAGCSAAPPEPTGPEGILVTITTPPSLLTSTPAPRPAETSTSAALADGWYLALGDSLAAGKQLTTDHKDQGYAGPVLQELRKTSPGTQLRNLGCSGETTTSMLRGTTCSYPEGNQVAAAVAFLKANADTTRLVTLDIGANNVLPCAKTGVMDVSCATSGTVTAGKELGLILAQIRAAAPKVPIVLLTYYDPLLAAWQQNDAGKKLAAQSLPLLGGLNTEISKAAKAGKAKVADVAGAFATSDTSGSPRPNNVSRICDWTWMCSNQDIHANDAGYAAMAKAVLTAR